MSNPQKDLLKRTEFINNQLRSLRHLLETGGCIGFTAPFGGGKSWICDQFIKKIQEESLALPPGIKPIKIDASFDQYDAPEPLVPIWSALDQACSGDKKFDILKKKILGIIKFLPPLASILGVDVVPLISLINNDSSPNESIEKQIENYKKELSEYAKTQPLLFFVDELDRCIPEFTLKFLDRVRHYFTIPNVGFVLMINDKQLYKHIKHVLGDEDGKSYLEKFIPTLIPLPALKEKGASDASQKRLYDFYTGHLDKKICKDSFINMAVFLSEACFEENLRRDKKLIDMAKRFQKEKGDKYSLDFVDAYVIGLKVRDHHLFNMFMQGNIKEFWDAEQPLIAYFSNGKDGDESVYKILSELKKGFFASDKENNLIAEKKFGREFLTAIEFIRGMRSLYSPLLIC